jgi:hypothetical protein
VNQSFEPVHETSHIEVYQQPKMKLGKFKISENLGFVDTIEFLNRLEFDNYEAVHEEVNPEAAIHANTSVDYGHFLLTLDDKPTVK